MDVDLCYILYTWHALEPSNLLTELVPIYALLFEHLFDLLCRRDLPLLREATRRWELC
jgi:hypothetical protein